MLSRWIMAVSVVWIGAGCATGPDPGRAQSLVAAESPGWSVRSSQNEMAVAVSPAGRSLRIAGTTGAVLGAGIDAVANSSHRRAIREVLDDYDAGAVFVDHLADRMNAAFGGKMRRVQPLGSTAGLPSTQAAEAARWENLAKQGVDVVLDLDLSYGLYGYEGILVAKIDGDARQTSRGRRVWSDSIVVSTDSIMGTDKLTDPTSQWKPNVSNPRLRAGENAIGQWTGDGGVTIRSRYEEAVEGAVSALLTALGAADEALGHYYLGKLAMNRKKFDEALRHFDRALALDGDLVDASNGKAVTLGHAGRWDEALAAAEALTAAYPEYGPGWCNLAWVLVEGQDDTARARVAYAKALELGESADDQLERRLR